MLYIPACPLTPINAQALANQRAAFLAGVPGPDFPGGKGESEHIGRAGLDDVLKWTDADGMRAMGLMPWRVGDEGHSAGAQEVLRIANDALGFDPEGEERNGGLTDADVMAAAALYGGNSWAEASWDEDSPDEDSHDEDSWGEEMG